MIWVDRVAKEIKQRKLSLEWVDDMKTPSGKAHAGSLRTIVIHDMVYKVLIENNVNTKFTYFFDDHDPMDGLPIYLDKNKWQKYLGMQLYKIPSPEPGYVNYAECYAKDFQKAFEKINCHPEIIWSSKLYNTGRMNEVIKEILDNAKIIRDIYKTVTKKTPKKDWIPFNVVCQQCNKVSTTKSYKWDGQLVYYRCEPDAVEWTKGCGYEGKTSPYNGTGKLPWKIEWAAKWKVMGITVEAAGKEHMTKGGSHDIASAVCNRILKYPVPYGFAYEFFTIGGKKMSSSKGAGISAQVLSDILPPEVLRFLIVRVPIKSHLDFNPYGETIPNIFDDYDRCLKAFFDKLENKVPEGKPGEVILEFARIMELSEVKSLPEKRIFLPRFRTIANLLKSKTDLLSFFEKQKKSKLNEIEKEMLEERKIFAQVYIDRYAQKLTASVRKTHFDVSIHHNRFLKILGRNLLQKKPTNNDSVKAVLLDSIKETNINPKEAFQVFYQVLLGENFGPKAADLIMELGIDEVVKKINQRLSTQQTQQVKIKHSFSILNDASIFSIDSQLAKKFPSMNIGIAIIHNLTIQKSNNGLNREIDEFFKSQSQLTTEMIGQYPEIQSYRKLYREMKIDWHSRRPSPEALLRRIALKKGLYKINACVDAYNLVVMKNRVSSGAFDLDKIKLPTVIRLAKKGEKILLLGDTEPTEYEPTEIAYFDQVGGYNIDFNYRDAQRTAVTEKTKNILINIDGIYDITREMVEKTLKETIGIITKYCGGQVELAAVAAA